MSGDNFKLGLFVTIAVALAVALLLMFGVLERFKPSITVETYFYEPIRGLQPGATVRFRGLDIGQVGSIELVSARYALPDAVPSSIRRAIIVDLKLDPSVFKVMNVSTDAASLNRRVGEGLRTRLEASGIGGPTFVQMDFVEEEFRTLVDIPWTPDLPYVPSAPSEIGSIITNLDILLSEVTKTKLVENLSMLAGIGPDIRKLSDQIADSDLLPEASASLEELREASAAAREFLADERLSDLLDEASTTMVDVRRVIKEGSEELGPLTADVIAMSASLQQAAGALDTLASNVNDHDLIGKLDALAEELGPAGHDLSDLAERLGALIRDNDSQIADTIRSMRSAALELEALLEEAKANPSRMIFGDPPPQKIPGGNP